MFSIYYCYKNKMEGLQMSYFYYDKYDSALTLILFRACQALCTFISSLSSFFFFWLISQTNDKAVFLDELWSPSSVFIIFCDSCWKFKK